MSARPRQTRPNASKPTSNTVRSRQTAKERSTSSTTVTPSQLLQLLGDSANVTESTVGSLDILLGNLATEDAQKTAMKAVNATSSAISAVHKSGWLNTSPSDKYTLDNVKSTISAAKMALSVLRDHAASPNTERVALGIIGRLMAIQAWGGAWELIQGVKGGIVKLYSPILSSDVAPHGDPREVNILKLPLAAEGVIVQSEIAIVILTFLSYGLQILLQHSFNATHSNQSIASDLEQIINTGHKEKGLLLSWILSPTAAGIHKQLYPLCTSLLKTSEVVSQRLMPGASLTIRIYAVRCVLSATSSEEATWIWKQVRNIAASYVKSSPQDTLRSFSCLHTNLVACMETARTRNELALFKDPSFDALCQQWVKFATKANDKGALEYIHSLLPRADPSELLKPPDDSPHAPIQRLLVLNQVLEESIRNKNVPQIETHLRLASEEINRITQQDHQDFASNATKLFQSTERLRRRLRTDPNTESIQAIEPLLQKHFEGVIKLYSALLKRGSPQEKTRLDIVSASVEALIALSKAKFRPRDLDTYEGVYQHLENASNLVEAFYADYGVKIEKERTLDLQRCLSGAFWNLGSALYQAGRWDHSVPFISKSVDIDSSLLATTWSPSNTINQTWALFFEQMPKRAMLLANCFIKMNNRRRGYELYRTALICSLRTMASELEAHARAIPSSAIFLESKYSSIATNIERITYTGVLELFLGKEVNLKALATSLGLSTVMCGALIEQQIRSLERSLWKPGVGPVILHLLQDAAAVYSCSHPLRQARVLCTHLEYMYYNKCGWDDAHVLASTAIGLLETEHLKLDAPLASHRPQYLITINLWMAFHSHAHRDHKSLLSFAYKARDILVSSMAPELVLEPGKGRQSKEIAKQEIPKGKRQTPRVANSHRTQKPRSKGVEVPSNAAKPNITRPSSSSVTAGAVLTGPKLVAFDCPTTFWSQIEMSLHLFSALGLVHLKLMYLNICCSFLKTRESNLERDLYARLLIELASECARVGRIRLSNEKFGASLHVIQSSAASEQTRLLFLLRFAGFLAMSGNIEKGVELYAEAVDLSRGLQWDLQNDSTLERARSRIQRYALVALACSTFSSLQSELGNASAASRGYLQAMRIWNAAIDVTQRLDPRPQATPAERNPFDMGELASTLPGIESPGESRDEARNRFAQRPGPDGWHLVLSRELIDAQNRMAEHYLNKGNHRDAEYFILQGRSLSERLGAPVHVLKSICLQTDLQIRLWHADNGRRYLQEAQILSKNIEVASNAEVLRLEGQYYEHVGEITQAKIAFVEGQAQLRQYSETLDVSVGLKRSSSHHSAADEDVTLPSLLATLLSRQTWLSRDEDYGASLEGLRNLPAIGDIKVQEKILMARLANYVARRQLSQESSLGSLAGSVIAIPLGVVQSEEPKRTHSQQELTELLKSMEAYCWSVLPHLQNRGSVSQYREIALILVMSITTRTNLGDTTAGEAGVAVALLDFASSETLRREMLECIEQKLQTKHVDDMEWPTIVTSHGTNEKASEKLAKSSRSSFDEPDTTEQAEDASRAYWAMVRDRHSRISVDPSPELSMIDQLPSNWTVIHLSVSETEDSLFIARSRPLQRSLVFCVPLKRSNRNESDQATNGLSVKSVLEEMDDIVEESRQNGRRAGEVSEKGRESRAEWWAERKALDQRLCDLLENVEFCWLGAFKSIIYPQKIISGEDLSIIHDRFINFFAKITHKNEKKSSLPARLNTTLVECFSRLSPQAREEELEDFIYFFLDLFQFTGYRVFQSDLDIDEAVLDLRTTLKDIHSTVKRSEDVKGEHIFLVLDKRLQGIPWESIPILRGRSVSRIPSTSFLVDRLQLASALQEKTASRTIGGTIDSISVDPTRVYYLLNPEGDLRRTEETFAPWLKGMSKVGWSGIIGRRPAEFELRDALNRRDLFIYFGHGGAEQYIRGNQIRSSLRCSSTMLWGCSSGAMDEAGDFDRSGTPYNYLLGGCPSLVVNLWDVTDKDIDKFAQSVFNQLKLEPEAISARRQAKVTGNKVSIVKAVADSREVCKLKYLTGAAPVVYGIPFYL